jgi:hypothetical protein
MPAVQFFLKGNYLMLDTIHTDLLNACKRPGCPVCLLEKCAVDAYLQTVFREKENNLVVRNDIRDSLGLCREHTRRMLDLRLNKTISAAVGYHDVLLAVVQQLQIAPLQPKPFRQSLFSRKRPKPVAEFETVVQALSPRLPCPVCRISGNFTRNMLEILVVSLQEDTMQKALASSNGLCLPHLRQAFTQIQELGTCQVLLSLSIERFEALRRDLIEEIRQIENRKGGQGSLTESETWQKVVSAIAGEL